VHTKYTHTHTHTHTHTQQQQQGIFGPGCFGDVVSICFSCHNLRRLCVLHLDSVAGDQCHDVGLHVHIRQSVWSVAMGLRHCLAHPFCLSELRGKIGTALGAAGTLSSRERERDPHTASRTPRWIRRAQECRGEEEGGRDWRAFGHPGQ